MSDSEGKDRGGDSAEGNIGVLARCWHGCWLWVAARLVGRRLSEHGRVQNRFSKLTLRQSRRAPGRIAWKLRDEVAELQKISWQEGAEGDDAGAVFQRFLEAYGRYARLARRTRRLLRPWRFRFRPPPPSAVTRCYQLLESSTEHSKLCATCGDALRGLRLTEEANAVESRPTDQVILTMAARRIYAAFERLQADQRAIAYARFVLDRLPPKLAPDTGHQATDERTAATVNFRQARACLARFTVQLEQMPRFQRDPGEALQWIDQHWAALLGAGTIATLLSLVAYHVIGAGMLVAGSFPWLEQLLPKEWVSINLAGALALLLEVQIPREVSSYLITAILAGMLGLIAARRATRSWSRDAMHLLRMTPIPELRVGNKPEHLTLDALFVATWRIVVRVAIGLMAFWWLLIWVSAQISERQFQLTEESSAPEECITAYPLWMFAERRLFIRRDVKEDPGGDSQYNWLLLSPGSVSSDASDCPDKDQDGGDGIPPTVGTGAEVNLDLPLLLVDWAALDEQASIASAIEHLAVSVGSAQAFKQRDGVEGDQQYWASLDARIGRAEQSISSLKAVTGTAISDLEQLMGAVSLAADERQTLEDQLSVTSMDRRINYLSRAATQLSRLCGVNFLQRYLSWPENWPVPEDGMKEFCSKNEERLRAVACDIKHDLERHKDTDPLVLTRSANRANELHLTYGLWLQDKYLCEPRPGNPEGTAGEDS